MQKLNPAAAPFFPSSYGSTGSEPESLDSEVRARRGAWDAARGTLRPAYGCACVRRSPCERWRAQQGGLLALSRALTGTWRARLAGRRARRGASRPERLGDWRVIVYTPTRETGAAIGRSGPGPTALPLLRHSRHA